MKHQPAALQMQEDPLMSGLQQGIGSGMGIYQQIRSNEAQDAQSNYWRAMAEKELAGAKK
jgi:hypothetical protein